MLCLSGEVKRSLDYSAAVDQLGLRLGILRWIVEECCRVKREDIRLVGRLFVPEAVFDGEMVQVNNAQRELAREKWNFSLYLHTF